MIKLVAFDFDGTLADSVDFCLACFDKVFEKFMGDKAPTREDIYQTFGMNEPGVIRYFMGGFVPEAEEYFYQLHRDLHKEWCSDLYPGCRGLLDFLQSKALPMTILTGRSETTCRISLEVLKLEKYFVDMQNGSPEKNDKASQMLNLLKKFDLPINTAYSAEDLEKSAVSDKKRSGKLVNLIIPGSIGNCAIVSTDTEKLKAFIEKGL